MKLRLLALPVAAVVAFGTSSAWAHGAEAHGQVKDASGDSIDKSNAHDVTGASFTVTKKVTKTVKVVKKKRVTITTTTPKDLVIHLELAGTPDVTTGTLYEVGAEAPACGSFQVTYYKSPVLGDMPAGSLSECGPKFEVIPGFPIYTYSLDPAVTVGDDFIEWQISWSSLPKSIKLGKLWDAPYAFASVADPVFGIDTQTFTSIFGQDTAYDVAHGDGFRLS